MERKKIRSTISSVRDFDREWDNASIEEILSREQIESFIEKAYNNRKEPSRIYANIEFRKISDSYMKRINDVITMLNDKEKEIERLGRSTKTILNDKIRKIDILVNYIKMLERKLDENGIEIDKTEISKDGDLQFLTTRKTNIDTSVFVTSQSEYVEAEEIVLENDDIGE